VVSARFRCGVFGLRLSPYTATGASYRTETLPPSARCVNALPDASVGLSAVVHFELLK